MMQTSTKNDATARAVVNNQKGNDQARPRVAILDDLFSARGYLSLFFAYTDPRGSERIIPLVLTGDVGMIFPSIGEFFKMLRSQSFETLAIYTRFGFADFDIPRGAAKTNARRINEELEKLCDELDKLAANLSSPVLTEPLAAPFDRLRLVEEVNEEPSYSRLYFYLATDSTRAARFVGAYLSADRTVKFYASPGGLLERYFSEFAEPPLATVSLDFFEGRAVRRTEEARLSDWLAANLLDPGDSAGNQEDARC